MLPHVVPHREVVRIIVAKENWERDANYLDVLVEFSAGAGPADVIAQRNSRDHSRACPTNRLLASVVGLTLNPNVAP